MTTPIQERAIHCIRRLILGICNEPQRCSVSVKDNGQFPKIVAQPCKSDFPILHGSDGRQTHAFMAMAQRLGVQYELVDNHGVEGPPRDHSSYLNSKITLDEAVRMIDELAFLLFGRQVRLAVGPRNGMPGAGEVKVRIEIDRTNDDEAAIVRLLADLIFPFSWNQLDTVIKVRPAYQQRRKATI